MCSKTVSFPLDSMDWPLLHRYKKRILNLYNIAMDQKNIEDIEALETCLAVLEKLLECAPYSAESV